MQVPPLSALWIGVIVVLIVLSVKALASDEAEESLCFCLLALVYWCGLAFAHSRALVAGSEEAELLLKPSGERVMRLAVMPTLANPFTWDCVFETEQATYRFELSLRGAVPLSRLVRYPKTATELAEIVPSLADDRRVMVFLGFARFPVMQLADPGCATRTLVQLADLRYTERAGRAAVFHFSCQ